MAKIFSESQTYWLEYTTYPTPLTLDVGKVLTGTRDPNLKVGDKVYLTFTIDVTAFSSLIPDDYTDYFTSFFSFWTDDTDESELSVTLLEIEYPTGTIDSFGNAIGNYVLTYILDLSDLYPGEKIVNLWVWDDQAGTVEYNKPISSDPFYLHQSILDKFQKNIANEGIDEDRTGLDRDKVNFPSYLPIGLQPVNPFITKDVALWEVIRNGTTALSFNNYSAFMDYIFCGGLNPFGGAAIENEYKTELVNTDNHLSLPFNNVDAYRALKVATEAFVMATVVVSSSNARLADDYNKYLKDVSTGIPNPADAKVLPYLALIRQKLPDLTFKFSSFDEALTGYLNGGRIVESCYGLIASKLQFPVFLELIWNYWHEESMMVQGITAVAKRFQNIRSGSLIDPLANLEIGPLRPVNNLVWGYIQDEQHRLTVRRRAYEYNHEYGITLQGNAVQGMRMADSRTKFIEAFHTLLNLCQKFYYQYDDTTVVADAFPIMNALKEVHMILSEGAHNQFGDLPSTARIEMLMQLYILARPEFREFLPTRQMVAYPEPWMDRVAVLNQMHNWTKTNVIHYRDLGVFGEQIVLSIRWGAWSDVINRDQAANWAIFWRPQIQNYIHAYRAVTGVDLSREDGIVDALQPSVHLLRRLKEQNIKLRI